MAGYNLGTASGRIVVDGSGASAGFAVAQAASESFYGVLQDKLSAIEDFGENLMKASAVGAAGFALAGNAAANFEERLSAVRAVSGATEEQMAAISEEALRIGASTKFSATEAASAFEELVKAGISVDDALNGAAQATADLAAAGEVALPRAAEIAATAMNNFNMTGADMPKVANLIAGAANASAISVDEFAMSLSQVGAVANLTGLSFDDTAVAIAEMGNAGIKGSDAGTSLKTMLMNLIPVTKGQVTEFERLGLMAYDSNKAMEALASNGITPVGDSLENVRQAVSDYLAETEGIPNDTKEMGDAIDKWLMKNGAMNNAFFDTEGNMESLRDVQQALNDATKDLTKEQKLASLELLFGSDAIRGAAVMAENGAAGFDELAASMGKVTAQDVSATRLDNLKGDLEELAGAWETAIILIGQIVIPIGRNVVQALTAAVNVFNALDKATQDFISQMGLTGTVVSGAVGAFIKMVYVATPLLLVFMKFAVLRTIWKIFNAGWTVFRTGAGIMAAATASFNVLRGALMGLITIGGRVVWFANILKGLWTALMGPIGIVIAVILTLAAVFEILYRKWEPFRNLVDGIVEALRAGFVTAVEAAVQAWQAFSDGFSGGGGMSGVLGVIQQLGGGVRALFESFQSGVASGAGFEGMMSRAGAAARTLWDTVVQAGQAIAAAFVPAWEQIVSVFQAKVIPAFQTIMTTLGELWTTIQTQIVPVVSSLVESFAPVALEIFKVAGAIAGTLIGTLMTLATFIIGTILPVLIQFGAWFIVTLLPVLVQVAAWVLTYLITPFLGFINFLLSLLIPTINILSQIFQVVFPIVAAIVMDTVGQIMGILNGLITFFTGIINVVRGIFTGDWGLVWEGVKQIVSGAFQAIYNFVMLWLLGKILGVARAGLSLVRGLFDTAFKAVRGVVDNVLSFIGSLFSSIFGAIRGTVSSGMSFVRSTIDSALSFVRGIWSSMWNGLSSTVSGAIGAVRGAVDNVISAIKSPFAAAGSFLSGVGGKIIDGLIGGIQAGFGKVKSTLSSLTSMLPDWKGPEKRDKVLLKPAGQLIMDSLVDGLESETDKVYRLLNGMNTDIPMALQAVLNPPVFSQFDAAMMAGTAPINSGQLIPEVAGTTLAPQFDVTVRIGDRDITDIVDIRIEEQMNDAADMIGTGVNN